MKMVTSPIGSGNRKSRYTASAERLHLPSYDESQEVYARAGHLYVSSPMILLQRHLIFHDLR